MRDRKEGKERRGRQREERKIIEREEGREREEKREEKREEMREEMREKRGEKRGEKDTREEKGDRVKKGKER